MDTAGPILILVAFALIVVFLGYLAYQQKKRRREAFFALANKLGLRYDEGDPFDTVDLPFDLFLKGDRRGVENTVFGETGGMRVRLFDYYFVERHSDGKGGSSESTYRFSCALGEIDADCPHLVVEQEGFLSSLARGLGFHDIETESEEFNKAFKISSDDRRFAFAILDQRMMAWLLDEGGICQYETMGPLALCYLKRVDPDEYENMLEVLRRFRAHVPEVVASLYPRGKEAHA